jgi:hypothetical protein
MMKKLQCIITQIFEDPYGWVDTEKWNKGDVAVVDGESRVIVEGYSGNSNPYTPRDGKHEKEVVY